MDRTNERAHALIQGEWNDAEEKLSGLDDADTRRLAIAVSATDAIWDRLVFDRADSFGGPEVGDARTLSSAILTSVLDVEYAALASAAGGSLPPSGNPVLDEVLEQACHDALHTFSDELLGPEMSEGSFIYGLPILLDSPVPVGAVLLATSSALTARTESLLREFLRHLDTRLTAAENLYSIRRELGELKLKTGTAAEAAAAGDAGAARGAKIPEGFAETVREMAVVIPRVELFGIELPMAHYGDFCSHLVEVSERYLSIMEDAESLYLDIPTPVDAKSGAGASAPYLRLLDVIRNLRPAVRTLYRVTPGGLALFAARHGVPNFSDLTRAAKQHARNESVERILDIMNDEGEQEEIDALYARRHPYEFRAANVGEVFALIALHRTLMLQLPDRLEQAKPRLLAALTQYQAARAFLFAYEHFADVPLKGEKRHDPRNAQSLLFRKKDAPSFGLLLRAYQEGSGA
jgi:hypothetical protein